MIKYHLKKLIYKYVHYNFKTISKFYTIICIINNNCNIYEAILFK